MGQKVTGDLDAKLTAFASQVKLSRSRIRDIMSGKTNVTVSDLQKLSDYFKMELWEFILTPDDQKALKLGRKQLQESQRVGV